MRLKPGQQAPIFTQRDMYERTVSLSQFRGRRILLSFYRGAVCPLCNLRLRYLIDRYDDYRHRGMEMIVFFESSPEMARRYLERQRPPFPIIPDLGRVVYSLYGLESSLFGAMKARLARGPAYREAARYHIGGNFWQNLFQMDGIFGRKPADFLLGPDLRIQSAYYGRDAGDFMSFKEIERFLATPMESPWQNRGYPPAPANPASGYPYPGRSASGPYPSHPSSRPDRSGYPGYSGPSYPETRRSGDSGHSGHSGHSG